LHEGDHVRPPSLRETQKIAVRLDLQINQPHLVAGGARSGGDQLQPKRFQPQKYLRVHQRAGMDAEEFHTAGGPLAIDIE
jgi:hypothetical protein